MDLANIKDATKWFEVLQTSKRSQTAMMALAPGHDTGNKAEAHEKSDQVLLMLSGKLSGTVGPESVEPKKGRRLFDPRRNTAPFQEYRPATRGDV